MQTWDDGGTAHILPKERAKASFDVERLTHVLDGGEEFTEKRRWIQRSHDGAFAANGEMDRIGQIEDHADKPRGKVIAESMAHFMDVHWKHIERGYRPKGQDMTFMSGAKFGNTGPLSLHYGVFMSTMRSQTSKEQREWWVEPGMRLNYIGCYAQTELGHGSNVRGLQTTATYDKAAEEWIMDTPTLQSCKWWSTGMYSATHAAVYAQLIFDGKPRGVHVFFVQLRGPDLKPLPGIEMGDIGAKLGDNDTPIGYLRMKNVRIPRRHLLEARSHITKQGKFVLGPPAYAASGRDGGEKRNVKLTKKKKSNVSHYITMLKTRIGLTNTAGSALAKAATIATRYSAVRLQGFSVGSSGIMNGEETQILDYKNQLFRVLKWISTAFAIKFVARWLLRRRKEAEATMKSGTGSNDDLPEVHASAAGLKALCCCLAADGIEDLRRACGGHGYLMSSGIAPLEADFKGPNTTAEGDYVVLALQTARFLLKMVDAARDGRPAALTGTTLIFKVLADAGFDPSSGHGRPSPPKDLVSLLTSSDENSASRSRTYLTELFAYRSLVRCSRMSVAYHESLRKARMRKCSDPIAQARLDNARALQTGALAHVRYFMLSKLFSEVEKISHGPERLVCHRIATFFAISEMANGGSGWAGILTQDECDAADCAVDRLCELLRPECVALVDAFDISDTVLNSALGKYDGRVYEALYKSARHSSLNYDEDTGQQLSEGVPECLRAVEQYLDTDFLARGFAKGTGGPSATPGPLAKL